MPPPTTTTIAVVVATATVCTIEPAELPAALAVDAEEEPTEELDDDAEEVSFCLYLSLSSNSTPFSS